MAKDLGSKIASLKENLKAAKPGEASESASPQREVKKVVKKVIAKKVAKKAAKGNGGAPRGPQEVPDGYISVAQLAEEAEITPQSARVKLRTSEISRPEGRWLWKKGSSQLKEARKVLGLS
jgi:hypothetical protein